MDNSIKKQQNLAFFAIPLWRLVVAEFELGRRRFSFAQCVKYFTPRQRPDDPDAAADEVMSTMTLVIDNTVRGKLIALQYRRAEHPTAKQGVRKLVLLCADREPPHELRKRWYDALLPQRGAVFSFVTSAWH